MMHENDVVGYALAYVYEAGPDADVVINYAGFTSRARSVEEATGIGIKMVLRAYPREHGYSNHNAVATPVMRKNLKKEDQ